MGKSRIARDFAASKGAYAVFGGRPGDEHVPYSTTVRTWRQMLAQRPEVRAGLEPWVRAELGRNMLRITGASSDAFSHDLVFEAVLAAIPPPVARLLHQRLAAALEWRGAPPSQVAHHWQESLEPQRAVPFLLRAAAQEDSTLRHAEAEALRVRAASLSPVAGRPHDG
jgi:hypothetical protein